MWKTKHFKTYAEQTEWILKNDNKYQITIIFVENGYAVEYKKLRMVY